MKTVILEIQDLSLGTKNRSIVSHVSLQARQGEVFALIGESGSGKSLTSLAIMRLLPQAIKVLGGDVLLGGKSLFALPEYAMQKIRGKHIAMIFQEPMSALNPVITIGEQVAEVLKLHLRLSSKEAKERVISLFEEVALPDATKRYDWYPHQLSGGQKQRVMIAMALACEPELLIADEPTTALDVTTQAQILSLLNKIKKERQLSMIFITHDMAVVAQVADRIAVMHGGEIVEEADREHFFSSPVHPYTKKLLQDTIGEKESREYGVGERLLKINNLKVYFPVKKGFFQRTTRYIKAVDRVTLAISKGKTLALVGESGSGKSTLGQAILSLVPITAGCIHYKGIDLTMLSDRKKQHYRQKIQVIFQDPFSALNPRMNIAEILREGMESLQVGPKKRETQDIYMKQLLKSVEMDPEMIYRYPHEFSGGQRQRIGIARALAVEPELIICDEPTSALDVSIRLEILSLLRKLQAERGVSYLFITHDLSIVSSIADEVAVMKEGKIVEQGTVDQVMQKPKHAYTQTLLSSVPTLIQKRRYDHTI
ncbi:MAG: ABC transporter ATP-binding protein [Sulfurovum sp.]|nr:ABC transporter ATP-binding protein [Sulfurovum sp.]MCB4759269.1 ABC transporter ATP-binding protein [Sulfurovum sp.]